MTCKEKPNKAPKLLSVIAFITTTEIKVEPLYHDVYMLQSITVCFINMYNYIGKFPQLMRLEATLFFNVLQMENLGKS